MKKKIAHVQLLPLLAGAQNVMLAILASLDPAEFEITVISKADGPLVDRCQELNYRHIAVKNFQRSIGGKDFLAFSELYRIMRKHKFDIVHTHSSKSGFIGRVSARLAGVPKIIHTVHGYPFNEFQAKPVQLFYQFLEKTAASFCDYVVFVNNGERKLAIQKRWVKTQQAVTIFNGVKHLSEKPQSAHDDIFTIGSILRFWEQKNIITTIQVAIDLCNEISNVKFIFLGDGMLHDEATKLVAENSLQERIILPGWQSNVGDWLRIFDLFLLYSKWEGLPMSILEAMSYGLPIVASDISGNDELVDSTNGILVDINDPNKLKVALKEIAENRDKLSIWSENSYKKISEIFNLESFSQKYKELYRR